MAWEETDKALAELLRRIPEAAPTITFLIGIAIFIYTLNRPVQIPSPSPRTHQQTPTQEITAQAKREPAQNQAPIPPTLTASEHTHDAKSHLLLCATGSVATIKLPSIIAALTRHRAHLSIRLLLTPSAAEFLQSQSPEQPSLATLAALPAVEALYLDADEWRKPWVRGDSILHIELRRWADLMVIAPLSANGLAKLALGLSDSVVYSVARAWDTTGCIDEERPGVELPYATGDGEGREGRRKTKKKKGIVVAPAMNTAMWNHPVTKRHLDVLEGEWNVSRGGWIEVLRPIDKGLACGDKGGGAMREWRGIVRVIEERLGLNGEEEGKLATEVELDEYVAVTR